MKKRYIAGIVVIVLIGFRIYLPTLVTNFINKTLKEIPEHTGSISDVDIQLYRGAYKIYDLNILKADSTVMTPFFSANEIDLSVEWSSLFKGKIVGEIEILKPTLNFVASSSESQQQYGEEVDWTKPLKELLPISINRLKISDGEIHLRNFTSKPKIDLYLNDFQAEVTNLRNAENSELKLPSDLKITANSIGNGQLKINGKLNILKQIPDMDLNMSFENVDLPSLNDFLQVYSKTDAEKGVFNLYSEVLLSDKKIDGYIKPIITDLKLVNLKKDIKKPLQLVWESIAGTVLEIFENQKKDQFATKIPLTGSIDATKTEVFKTLWNIFHNAFIQAFKKSTDDSINLEDQNTDQKQ